MKICPGYSVDSQYRDSEAVPGELGADSRRRKSVTISTSPPRALRTNNPYLDHMYYAKIMDKGVCNSKDTTRCASVSRVL